MALNLTDDCRGAINLAKRSLPDGAALDLDTLLPALYAEGTVQASYPDLEAHFPPPRPLRTAGPERVRIVESLQPVFDRLANGDTPISARQLFDAILLSDAGRRYLLGKGASEAALHATDDRPGAEDDSWRSSAKRTAALRALASYGRALTDSEPPHGGAVEREQPLQALIRVLSKMGRKNAIIVGQAGTGKSALVYELARRLFRMDPSLPIRLRDHDIFELSPSFLRSGASMVGQYDERVKSLIQVLMAHCKIILFVDEIHSLFQSGVHERGPFTDANESFKSALGRGEITCIGCTTLAEYRHAIEPDTALARRFSVITLDPPSRQETRRILEVRRGRMQEYFAPLLIPDSALDLAIDLTEEFLPSRAQPDKSIQLLDESCAYCTTRQPPLATVDEASLRTALADLAGHAIVRTDSVQERDVFDQLSAKIVGQDGVLHPIARAFVAGLGAWSKRSGPRGVYLFGGPTGVGKTETALLLSRLLGAGEECLIRVDCNTLPPSVSDSGPVLNRLLGAPPGYVGYARGQGGLLSRIRDQPESIVLFDEFEKAGAVVGRLLLQVIDKGYLDDTEGNRLDFRRSYIILTTNAGCGQVARSIGYEASGEPDTRPIDVEAIKTGLRQVGVGDEFLGRVTQCFLFQPLTRADVAAVLERRLGSLRDVASNRGLTLSWTDDFVPYLAEAWQPQFGVRFASSILRTRITEQLDVADAQGELAGVRSVKLCVAAPPSRVTGQGAAGTAARIRDGDTLVITIA